MNSGHNSNFLNPAQKQQQDSNSHKNEIHADEDEQIEDDHAEEFFAFQGDKKKRRGSQIRPRADSAQYNVPDNNFVQQNNPAAGLDNEFQIDDMFGKIFGIERVHIMKKSDKLQDVIEKISIVPENKLVYIEENPNNKNSFQVQNVLTQGDLLTYLCPTGSQEIS